MPDFVRGRDLARAFYEEAIAPLIGIPHAAALLGWGSDVLGYDTTRSTDHGWGPRLQVFVAPGDVEPLSRTIEAGLPARFGGWRTRFGWDEVTESHHVEVAQLGGWLRSRLGFDPAQGITPRDWLSTPQQVLLEVTSGPVFHDDPGELTHAREALAWYPDELWLWLLACQWRRIDQEEPFVGRAAEVEDELGSRVTASRLVRDLIRLSFLLERRYAPYAKWLGSAFASLDTGREIGGSLMEVLQAEDYPSRETALLDALRYLAGRQNGLLSAPVDPSPRLFHERPYRVIGSDRFVRACLEAVSDPWLKSLPLLGGIDQFVDSTDVLSSGPSAFRRAAAFYESRLPS